MQHFENNHSDRYEYNDTSLFYLECLNTNSLLTLLIIC